MTNQYADETLVRTANIVARLIDDGETIVGHDAVSSASVARVLGISRKAAQDRLTACPDVTTVDGLDPETLRVTKGWMFVVDLNPTDTVDRGRGIETDGGTATVRMPELPDFQRDILLVLAISEPTHGQGIVEDLSTLRDEDVNNGRLYPNLDELAGQGLVEKSIRATDGRSNEYRLTPAGRAAVRSHARRVGDAVDALDFDSDGGENR